MSINTKTDIIREILLAAGSKEAQIFQYERNAHGFMAYRCTVNYFTGRAKEAHIREGSSLYLSFTPWPPLRLGVLTPPTTEPPTPFISSLFSTRFHCIYSLVHMERHVMCTPPWSCLYLRYGSNIPIVRAVECYIQNIKFYCLSIHICMTCRCIKCKMKEEIWKAFHFEHKIPKYHYLYHWEPYARL